MSVTAEGDLSRRAVVSVFLLAAAAWHVANLVDDVVIRWGLVIGQIIVALAIDRNKPIPKGKKP